MAIDMGANAVRLRVFFAAAARYLTHIFYLLLLSLFVSLYPPLTLSICLYLFILPLIVVQCT